MLKTISTASLSLIFCISAHAQAEKFEGASVGLNTGYGTQLVQATGGGDTFSLGENQTPFNIDATYNFAINNSFLVGIGATYDFAKTTVIAANHNPSGANAWSLNKHYSLNFEPGVAISESALGYGKVAYHSASSEILTFKKKITGTGIGFGTKLFFDKNLYLKMEVEKVTYGAFSDTDVATDVKHTSTLGTIGLGYKF